MKKAVFGLLIVMAIVLSSGCMEKTETKQEVIHAYVGAGMQKPMDEIGKLFEEKYGIKVEYDYAGSGYLYSKILASSKPIVAFISLKLVCVMHKRCVKM